MALLNPKELTIQEMQPEKGTFSFFAQRSDLSHFAKSISEITQSIDLGFDIHFVNKGVFDMHELFIELLGKIGKCHVAVCSYAMNETAARVFSQFKDEGYFLSLKFLIDSRVEVRTAGSLQLMRSIANKMCLCVCHAKVTILYNEHMQIVVVGSANYTENKRYEVGFVSTNPTIVDFHKKWIDEAFEQHGEFRP